MPVKKKSSKILLCELLTSCNWQLDRFGNYKKTIAGSFYRIKLGKTSFRYERKSQDNSTWINSCSCYYKNITFSGSSIEGLNFGGFNSNTPFKLHLDRN